MPLTASSDSSPFHSRRYPQQSCSTLFLMVVRMRWSGSFPFSARTSPHLRSSLYVQCTVSPLQAMLKGLYLSQPWEDIDIEAICDVVLPRRGRDLVTWCLPGRSGFALGARSCSRLLVKTYNTCQCGCNSTSETRVLPSNR